MYVLFLSVCKHTEFLMLTIIRHLNRWRIFKKSAMKQPHNLSIGDQKKFNNFQELQNFADKFTYQDDEFQFINTNPLVMIKVN